MRSDGWWTSVTNRYSDGSATITIYALDNQGNPIDGAEVLFAVQSGTSIYVDNYGITDNEGKCTFIVGEGKHYYARVDSDIGSYPVSSSSVVSLVNNAVSGEEYSYSLNVSGTMPSLYYVSTDVPEDTNEDYRLEVSFTVPTQIVTGVSLLDDLDDVIIHKHEDGGSIDHVMISEDDLVWYLINETFDAFNVWANADQGNMAFDIPVGNDWYSCFSNMLHLNNYQYVEGSAKLYYYSTSVDDPIDPSQSSIISSIGPNPFNDNTTIRFSLAKPSLVRMDVYNVRGEKVRTLVNEALEADSHTITWDSKDSFGKKVSSGIYFCKIKADNQTYTKKMILMKE